MTQISDTARALLDLLHASGRPANLGRLRSMLHVSPEEFERAQSELVAAQLAEIRGRGGRIARVNGRAAAPGASVSFEAEQLLAALPKDGSSISNFRLRSRLDLDNETYSRAKQDLQANRLIRVGPGRGGTVARVEAIAASSRRDVALVVREHELYEPFCQWLGSNLADQNLAFAQAKITATPERRRRASGKWSRPDVTAVQLTRFEWLPDVSLEISSYEIKRAADMHKLENIYEAAAHGRWAHRASLVIEEDPDGGAMPEDILGEIRRFRLGLYVMRRREDGRFEIREELAPDHQDPEPQDINELLDYFFKSDLIARQNYRAIIG